MPIFMTHAEHGATHVGSGEVAEHEKNGWKQDTYENWIAKKNAPVAEITIRPRFSPSNLENVDIDTLRIAYKEKFGKAAHHKKTAEWLRTELA